MSSKLTHLVWNYRTDKVEDKLLLLALAELADRKGNFETSVAELAELTSMNAGMVKTVLSHFANSWVKLVKLPPREPQRDTEMFSGALTIDGPQTRTLPVMEMDLMEKAREQNERLNQNKKPITANSIAANVRRSLRLTAAEKRSNTMFLRSTWKKFPIGLKA